MTTPRRRFLGWLGGSSVLGAAWPSLGHALERPGEASEHPQPVADTWDMSWTERVTGKYRAVFDSPQPSDGAALFRAVAWCDMYKDVYGADRTEMSPVVVFRHSAMPLIMSNAYWERYEVGKKSKLKDEKGKWAKANPVSTGGAELAASAAKYKLETFLAGGGVVLACNWAFGGIVSTVREKEKFDHAAARARAIELMIPGVILQPNGIFAALRAQEAGCKYIMAS
ncbi:MAG: hypothetical protein H7066_09740 [Cytophagaceae bacterium]|nr:hypothetical protein [Gemmatimonadaceae bacterium]